MNHLRVVQVVSEQHRTSTHLKMKAEGAPKNYGHALIVGSLSRSKFLDIPEIAGMSPL